MKTDTLIQDSYWQVRDETDLAASTLELANQTRAMLNAQIKTFREKSAQILTTYKADAAKIALGELRNTSNEKLAQVRGNIVKVAETAGMLVLRMEPEQPSGEPVVRELRALETRDYVRGLDPIMRAAVVHERARRGDSEFLAAIRSSPTAPICSNAVMSEADAILKASTFPEINKQLRATLQVETALRALLADFERELGIGIDSIREMAVGPLTVKGDPAVDSEVRRRAGVQQKAG